MFFCLLLLFFVFFVSSKFPADAIWMACPSLSGCLSVSVCLYVSDNASAVACLWVSEHAQKQALDTPLVSCRRITCCRISSSLSLICVCLESLKKNRQRLGIWHLSLPPLLFKKFFSPLILLQTLPGSKQKTSLSVSEWRCVCLFDITAKWIMLGHSSALSLPFSGECLTLSPLSLPSHRSRSLVAVHFLKKPFSALLRNGAKSQIRGRVQALWRDLASRVMVGVCWRQKLYVD